MRCRWSPIMIRIDWLRWAMSQSSWTCGRNGSQSHRSTLSKNSWPSVSSGISMPHSGIDTLTIVQSAMRLASVSAPIYCSILLARLPRWSITRTRRRAKGRETRSGGGEAAVAAAGGMIWASRAAQSMRPGETRARSSSPSGRLDGSASSAGRKHSHRLQAVRESVIRPSGSAHRNRPAAVMATRPRPSGSSSSRVARLGRLLASSRAATSECSAAQTIGSSESPRSCTSHPRWRCRFERVSKRNAALAGPAATAPWRSSPDTAST